VIAQPSRQPKKCQYTTPSTPPKAMAPTVIQMFRMVQRCASDMARIGDRGHAANRSALPDVPSCGTFGPLLQPGKLPTLPFSEWGLALGFHLIQLQDRQGKLLAVQKLVVL
jgi:hypothetical protein